MMELTILQRNIFGPTIVQLIKWYKLPTMLSGGQQQRVAIARALANDPPIIVADEPTGNLDSKTAEAVFNLFESLVNQGKTFVMVTHDAEMARRMNRVISMTDGQIVSDFIRNPARTTNPATVAPPKALSVATGSPVHAEGAFNA